MNSVRTSGYITDSLGWVHYKLGNLTEAAGYLETAVSLTDYETVVADHLGDVYLKQNRLEEALEVFQKALENRTEETDPAMLETIRAKIAEIEKQIQ